MRLHTTDIPLRSVAALQRQAAWEMVGVNRARKVFLEDQARAAEGGRFSETGPARRLLRRWVPCLAAQIELAIGEAASFAVAGRAGRPAPYADVLLRCEDMAEDLAVITVSKVLDALQREGDSCRIPTLAKAIVQAVEDELNYRAWVSETKAVKDDTAKRLLTRFKRTYPSPNTRQWRTWARKVEAVTTKKWDEQTRVQAGSFLIHTLVSTANADLRLEQVAQPGSYPVTCLVFTSEAATELEEATERMAVSSPRLLPMVVPPTPWQATPTT